MWCPRTVASPNSRTSHPSHNALKHDLFPVADLIGQRRQRQVDRLALEARTLAVAQDMHADPAGNLLPLFAQPLYWLDTRIASGVLTTARSSTPSRTTSGPTVNNCSCARLRTRRRPEQYFLRVLVREPQRDARARSVRPLIADLGWRAGFSAQSPAQTGTTLSSVESNWRRIRHDERMPGVAHVRKRCIKQRFVLKALSATTFTSSTIICSAQSGFQHAEDYLHNKCHTDITDYHHWYRC
jgi:hypothetical protein